MAFLKETVSMNEPLEHDSVLSGTPGEHVAQTRFGSADRAQAFYRQQVFPKLNDAMQRFVLKQEFVFIATANAKGHADSSFRAGPPGFIHIITPTRLAYPEYRGNGVMASVGNLLENPHVGMMFIDFFKSTIGLHVNGTARVVDNDELTEEPEMTAAVLKASQVNGGAQPECWVLVDVKEAYIHCAKHIPLLAKQEKPMHWGTDEERHKGGSFFQA
jgi:hypothetical protein